CYDGRCRRNSLEPPCLHGAPPMLVFLDFPNYDSEDYCWSFVDAWHPAIIHQVFLFSPRNPVARMATDLRLKETPPQLTDALLATYPEASRITHPAHKPLPSREAIVDILDDLMDVLYPGFVRRQNLHMGNVEYHVGDLVDGLHDKLTQQIGRALRHEYKDPSECAESFPDMPAADFEAMAQQKTVEFLGRLPELRHKLELDVEAAFVGDPAA